MNARLTKMVYLAEWRQAIQHNRQMSLIDWYFDNYGSFVWDIYRVTKDRPDLFETEETVNVYGTPKTLFKLKNPAYEPRLEPDEQQSLDHVVESTKRLGFDAFINLVYSTHPIVSSERYSFLNLVEKAAEYRQEQQTAS